MTSSLVRTRTNTLQVLFSTAEGRDNCSGGKKTILSFFFFTRKRSCLLKMRLGEKEMTDKKDWMNNKTFYTIIPISIIIIYLYL